MELEKQTVQLSLKAPFAGTHGVVTPLEERGRVRPSVVSNALEEAMKAGGQWVLASVRQMNEAVERLAEDRVRKLKAR